MQRVLALFCLFGVGLLCAQPATSQIEGSAPFSVAGTSAQAVDRFLAQLRDALAHRERAKVADMLQYPLQAWDGDRSLKIKTRKQLLRKFDRIFDSSLRSTISNASSETAFANWQGVMFDDGRIWLRPTDAADTLLIVTINAPAPK